LLAQNLVRQKVKNLSCEFFLNYYMGLKEFEKIDKVIDEVVLYYSINKKSLFLFYPSEVLQLQKGQKDIGRF